MDMLLEMEQLETAATRLDSLSSSMNGLRTNLSDLCSDTNSSWNGDCKDAYRVRCKEIASEIDKYADKLERLSTALRSAVNEYREMEGLQVQTVRSLSDGNIF